MNTSALSHLIQTGGADAQLTRVYGSADAAVKGRVLNAVAQFTARFGDREDVILLSAPGRTEIGGNHTDHQHGRVLAGAVNLDILAVVAPAAGATAILWSEGFPEDQVDLGNLSPSADEYGQSTALIRGTAAAMQTAGYQIGGFVAYTTSNVLKGSGLSSSAAFEVLCCNIYSHLYNEGRLSAVEAAKMGQQAENVFFGKPCGLMDQMASSVGAMVAIDFQSTKDPAVEKIDFDFAATGYCLCIVDTKGDHQNLTPEYAAIPGEMKAAAAVMGGEVLRDCTDAQLDANINAIRAKCGDRALLRAIHFMAENDRAAQEADALRQNDFPRFLSLVDASGDSSYMYLQNVSVAATPARQEVAVGLALTRRFLSRQAAGRGACRVHGGGFAGTIQAFIPADCLNAYQGMIESVFGPGSCHILSIRPLGGVRIL